MPKQQLGFYSFIVKPMYDAMALLVPLDRPFEHLAEVTKHWRAQLPGDDQDPSVAAPKPRSRRTTKERMRPEVTSSEQEPRSRRTTKEKMKHHEGEDEAAPAST